MGKTKLYFNKPIYLGLSILHISKILVYDFHYNYIKEKYGEAAKLLFTDTDSLCYEIKTKDFDKDISPNISEKFDTSKIEPNHPSGIKTGINKKVIGIMKDEMGGKIITEFVGLRPKMYSILMNESLKIKKCKGIKKSVINDGISHQDYKDCLLSEKQQMRKMNIIRSRQHEIYSESIHKVALSSNDDKRIIMVDKIHTLAIGHYKSLK